MQISVKGILEIAEHEGIVPAPYRDSVGVWTWGDRSYRCGGLTGPAWSSGTGTPEGAVTARAEGPWF